MATLLLWQLYYLLYHVLDTGKDSQAWILKHKHSSIIIIVYSYNYKLNSFQIFKKIPQA